MASLIKQFTFVADQFILPNQVNANFDDIISFLNTNVVHKDGTVAMTAPLELPGSDPASANQAARKAYVDTVGTNAQNAATNAANLKADVVASHNATAPYNTAANNWAPVAPLLTGGVVDAATNAAGDFTITFAQAFPTACLGVIVQSAIKERNFYYAIHETSSRIAVGVRVYRHDGTVEANSSTRVTYIAIGW